MRGHRPSRPVRLKHPPSCDSKFQSSFLAEQTAPQQPGTLRFGFGAPGRWAEAQPSDSKYVIFCSTLTVLTCAFRTQHHPRARLTHAGLRESPRGALLPRRSPERPWSANPAAPLTGFLERRSSQAPAHPAGLAGAWALRRRHSFSPGALGAGLGFGARSGLGQMHGSTQGGGDGAAVSELVTSLLGLDPDRGSAQGSTHGSPLPPPGGPGPAGAARLAGALAAAKPYTGRAASPGQGGTPASASDSGSFCSAWDSAPEGLGRVSPVVSSASRDAVRPPAEGTPAVVAALRARIAQLEAQLAAAGLPVAPAATSTMDSPAPRLPLASDENVRPRSLSGEADCGNAATATPVRSASTL